jgi:hypothetical protein
MKRTFPMILKLMVFSLCYLGVMQNDLKAQNYFSLTDISINPATPNNYEEVTLTLSGLQQDSCTSLNFFDADLFLFDLNIRMDWDSMPADSCNGSMIPWTNTINLGVLPDGVYNINLTGMNYSNDSGDPLSFVVTDLATGSCGTNDIVWVTNTLDVGPGSLRAAIDCSNGNSSLSNIFFDIAGSGPHEIRVGTTTGEALPAITSSTIIDATTQPGYSVAGGPAVSINGSYAFWATNLISGLELDAGSSAVYGLAIVSFPDNGIIVDGADLVKIGKPDGGNVIISNGVGIDPSNSPNNYDIGVGIRLINSALFAMIQSNYIGTDVTESIEGGNQYCGIFIQANCNYNLIGGDNAEDRNVISNNANGMRIEETADFNEILRNYFFCNDSIAVKKIGMANSNQSVPVIEDLSYTQISGSASPGDEVDVYRASDVCVGAPCQGNLFLGRATADAMGDWILNSPFETQDTIAGGEVITAIATGTDRSSSEFADCEAVVGVSACTDPGGVIWVTNAQDTGVGSLRYAMSCANTTLGANAIYFDILGTGPFTIEVGSITGTALPAISDLGTTIDGTTQPGHGVNGNFAPQITLSGLNTTWNSPDPGLLITGRFTEIYGLELIGFPNNAIEARSALDMFIGAVEKGNVIYNNGAVMDMFPGVPGQGPFEGNGIWLTGKTQRVKIYGNYIGTDYTETLTTGNEYCGILLDYDIDFVAIGGSNSRGNVIANNAEGIRVGDESFGVSILENAFMCNDSVAIRLEGVANNSQKPPVWDTTPETSLTMVSGTAEAGNAFVEIFLVDNSNCSTAPCQGKIYLGTASVSTNNEWVLNAPFANGVTLNNGDLLVATVTDTDASTSEFSECHIAANCTLSASGTNIMNASCNLANGSFTVAPSGGPAPYLFDMGLGEQTSSTFTNLLAGTYNISITDAYTCITETEVTITDPGVPMTSIQTVVPETCDEQNGFVVMNQGSGGVGPYAYNIGNGNQPNNPNFINLAGGDYTITITDATGCSNTAPITVPYTVPPVVGIQTIEDETCSSANGGFVVNTENGSPLYTYSIGGSGNGNTNPSFSGLPAGTYEVTVTDGDGCTDTESVTLVNVPGPTALTVVDVTPDYCGQSNGTFTVAPVGGTSPYVFDMGFGEEDSDFFANILGDIYTVTVTDANQCTAEVNVTVPTENGADLSIASSTDANCGQASGSVTISATAGALPYLYNIGNGNQTQNTFGSLLGGAYEVSVTDGNNCITILPFTINDIGGPTPSISTLTDATCEQINGSVTIFVTGGVSPFLYDIGNGVTGNPTFTALSPGVYNITVTDAASCSSVQPVTIANVGLLAVSNFTYTETNGAVAFTNTSENEETYSWDFGDGGTAAIESPSHTYGADGSYNVCLTVTNPTCGPHTSCQMVLIQTSVNVSGIVEKENGVPVANVEMIFSAGIPLGLTGVDGTYSVAVSSGSNFTVAPEKDTLYGNGVSGFDLFKIQRHILIVEALDSPYKIIAADVNHSNSVSTFDAFLMQQVILQIVDTFPNNTSWRFVDKYFVFPDATLPFATAFPEEVSINGLMGDVTDLDFIAIKVGDVTLDANPGIVANPPSGEIEMRFSDISWKEGEQVRLPVRMDAISDLAALQLNFEFDQSILAFENISFAGLNGLDESDFNMLNTKEGRLSLAWYDKEGLGQRLDENTTLFYLNFTAKSAGEMKNTLSVQPFRNNKNAYQVDGSAMNIKTIFDKEEASTVSPTYQMTVQPNPFDTHVTVLLDVDKSEEGILSVYDVSGRLVYSEELLLEKRMNRIRVDGSRFPMKGAYLLQMKTGSFVEVVRVVAE